MIEIKNLSKKFYRALDKNSKKFIKKTLEKAVIESDNREFPNPLDIYPIEIEDKEFIEKANAIYNQIKDKKKIEFEEFNEGRPSCAKIKPAENEAYSAIFKIVLYTEQNKYAQLESKKTIERYNKEIKQAKQELQSIEQNIEQLNEQIKIKKRATRKKESGINTLEEIVRQNMGEIKTKKIFIKELHNKKEAEIEKQKNIKNEFSENFPLMKENLYSHNKIKELLKSSIITMNSELEKRIKNIAEYDIFFKIPKRPESKNYWKPAGLIAAGIGLTFAIGGTAIFSAKKTYDLVKNHYSESKDCITPQKEHFVELKGIGKYKLSQYKDPKGEFTARSITTDKKAKLDLGYIKADFEDNLTGCIVEAYYKHKDSDWKKLKLCYNRHTNKIKPIIPKDVPEGWSILKTEIKDLAGNTRTERFDMRILRDNHKIYPFFNHTENRHNNLTFQKETKH
ncbi:hypothetical protein KY332_05290 [Candidatus Woesearchaeota archaeon]|nr:hypothetical protein [Candidatus Woesearchaeota archaeon]